MALTTATITNGCSATSAAAATVAANKRNNSAAAAATAAGVAVARVIASGKRQWDNTMASYGIVSKTKSHAGNGRQKKQTRMSNRTVKLSKFMKTVDNETRQMVRNARLDALEADNNAESTDAETQQTDGTMIRSSSVSKNAAAQDGDYVDGEDNFYEQDVGNDEESDEGDSVTEQHQRASQCRRRPVKKTRKKMKIAPTKTSRHVKLPLKKVRRVRKLDQLVFEEYGLEIRKDEISYKTAAVSQSSTPDRKFCVICGFLSTILVDDVDPIFVPFGVLKLTKKQDA